MLKRFKNIKNNFKLKKTLLNYEYKHPLSRNVELDN